ncbi:MAG: hypothetical protein IMW89_01075 [Ktedonobacteraceae bacterium]|nr:hypothetical protein [Ktedonobacteraceae bacterium]
MGWFRRKNAGRIDEHDMPTEPLSDSPYSAPSPVMMPGMAHSPTGIPEPYYGGPASPFAPPYAQPSPQALPPIAGSAYPGYAGFPQAPVRKKGKRPPAGAASFQHPWVGEAGTSRRARRSPMPALVGLLFVIVQLLLLARFVLKVMSRGTESFWVGVVYEVSAWFVWPFQIAWQQMSLHLDTNLEVYTLLAVLAYGLLSRLIVRLLKFLLNR